MIKINIADHDYANRERRRENPPLGSVALFGCGRVQAFTLDAVGQMFSIDMQDRVIRSAEQVRFRISGPDFCTHQYTLAASTEIPRSACRSR